MNSKFAIKALVFCTLFKLSIAASTAQVVTVTGPSDATTNPPASASAVSQVIKAGTGISIKVGSTTAASTDIVYQWYKIDHAGVKQLVQSSNNPVFTENSSDAGYYIYQLLISNSNQCTSEISDPFKIYALPALNPTIAASAGTVCSNGNSTAVLSATVGDSKYSYQYQWALNGTDISGATGATYTTTPANTSGNKTYSVKVAYALSASVTGIANQVISAIPVPTKPSISVGQ